MFSFWPTSATSFLSDVDQKFGDVFIFAPQRSANRLCQGLRNECCEVVQPSHFTGVSLG